MNIVQIDIFQKLYVKFYLKKIYIHTFIYKEPK